MTLKSWNPGARRIPRASHCQWSTVRQVPPELAAASS